MHENGSPRKTESAQTGNALPVAALLGGNVALAFGPWFVRLADVGPVAAAFWRIALALPLLVALCYAGKRRPFAGAAALWATLLIGGIAFAADLASWHLGILRTTLANATLFGNSATLMFPIYGFLVARAWPTRMQGAALLLAALGAALLLGRSYELSPKHLAGDLLCLLAGTLYTVYFVLMARARATMAPIPALALSSLASALPLLLFATLLGETVMPHHWGILIGLALASQVVGQGLMIYAIGHLSPLVVGIALLTQPIVAATVGWLAYGERLGWPDLLGAVMVAVALVLVRLAPDGGSIRSKAEGAA
ncbi:DMT family transporter [Sphingomonas sp. LB-2]|uniref:DMT family transporter n=1 Tax=Sphingomonas caeni TaxID=2984949 RepID=UPI002231323F|nr:DMT family transporter [Sphingomonas caeni]MCW3846866.1 DMT family transporter [Sphingomonas caeni]